MKLFECTLRNRAHLVVKTYADFIKPDCRVLDVGCGNGVISKIISDAFNCKIVGTDIMDYRKIEIDFEPMTNGDKLPFKDNSFDVVMFNDVLHHMPYETQTVLIKEALRVGKRVLIFELEPTMYAKITDWLANKVHNLRMHIPFTYRTLNGWETLLKENKINYRSMIIRRKFPSNILHLSYENLAELLYNPITNYFFSLEGESR